MPAVLIEVRRTLSPGEGPAIIDAVHEALISAFKIPASDKTIRLVVHNSACFAVSPRLHEPDQFVLVSIDAFVGRSLDAKRALYKNIVSNLVFLGIPPDHIKIILREIPAENWGIRGGLAASDVDLGFTVNI